MQSRALVAAVATLLMALPAVAQDTSTIFMNAQNTDQHLAKDTLIGAKVYGKDGTIIGDIEDLILSDGNTVVGVIIGTGGFLGLAEKRVGVDLSALTSSDKDGKISLPVSHEDLVATPAYQRAMPKKSLLERAKEKAQELKDKTTETSKDAYEKAKPTIDEAKEKAGEVYEKAKEKAGEAYEKAKEKVQDAVKEEAPAPAPETPAPVATPAPEATTPAPEAAPAQDGTAAATEQPYPPKDAYTGPGPGEAPTPPDAPAQP